MEGPKSPVNMGMLIGAAIEKKIMTGFTNKLLSEAIKNSKEATSKMKETLTGKG